MDKSLAVNYPLALLPAVVHVANLLDKAAGAALSFDDLQRGYKHTVASDLSRVQRMEAVGSEDDARQWIVRRALAHLAKWVDNVDDMYSFKEGKTFDNLRFDGSKVLRPEIDTLHAQLNDPFNPISGVFSDNIRTELKAPKDTAWDELKESMKEHGWVEEFPALVDENGCVLVGHRRMAIAKELGIAPVTKTISCGKGDYADAKRLRLAIVSNIAQKGLSPNDRKHIALTLYKDHEWSQAKIAEALNVDQKTISRDLNELGTVPNSKRGRPRKSDGLSPKKLQNIASAQAVAAYGKPREDIAKKLNVTLERVDEILATPLPPPTETTYTPPKFLAPEGPKTCICPHCNGTGVIPVQDNEQEQQHAG